MRHLCRCLTARGSLRSDAEQTRQLEVGDTLIEVLIALVVIGVAALSLLLAFSTSLWGSSDYRNVATIDTVLRTAAEETTSLLQQQPATAWQDCSGASDINSSNLLQLPSGYTATISAEYWNSTPPPPSFTSTCVPNATQLDLITVTYAGKTYQISVVVDDPLARPVAQAGASYQLVFLSQPSSGVSASGLSPTPVVAVEDDNGNIVTTDLSTVSLAITPSTNLSDATLSPNCSENEFYGVVTFANCSIDRAGIGYTLTASDGSLEPATSAAFNITPGPASQLAFTPTPPASVFAGVKFSVVVAEQDAYGNTETGDSTTTLTLAASGGGFSCTSRLTQAVTGGVATFTGCSFTSVSTTAYTLTASSGTLTPATTTTMVAASAATQLVYLTGSQTFVAGTGTAAGSGAVIVQLQDAYGNPVNATAAVALSFSGTSGVTYIPTFGSTTACTSSTCRIPAGSSIGTFYMTDNAANGASISVTTTANGLSTPAQSETVLQSSTFSGSVGISSQSGALSPTGTATYTITVHNTASSTRYIETLINGVPSSATSTLAPTSITCVQIAGGSSATWSLSVVTNGKTPAVTSKFSVVAEGWTTSGCSGTLGEDTETSGTLTITPGSEHELVVTTQPASSITAGGTVSLSVAVEDLYGNVLTSGTGSTDSIQVALSSGSFVASTTTATASSGVASFSGLEITSTAGSPYTIIVSDTTDTSVTPVPTNSVTVNPGPASQLAFTPATPGPGMAGNPIPSVAVSAEDTYGNVATSASGSVVMSIASGSPQSGFNSGATTVSLSSGVASFTNLVVDTSGSYTFTAKPSRISGVTAAVNSNAFTVSSSSTVNSLAITTIPSETAGSGFTVTATAKDAFGNVANNSVDSVTLSIVSGSPQTTFSNNGSTTMTTTLSSGVATFPAVAFDTAGPNYTLSAEDTSANETAPNSNAFTVRPAAASQLAFTTQPVGGVTEGTNFGTSPAVSVEDTYGNVVTTDTGHVTLATYSGPSAAALSCSNTGFPTISAVAGVATFTNCKITGTAAAGTYTLSASRTGLTQAVSGNVVINPGAASQLAFTPATPGPGVAGSVIPSVAVSAEDTYGNVATSASGSVVMSIASTDPQTSFTSGTTTVSLSSGVASFTNLVVDTSGSYTFTATPSGISGVTAAVNSNAFTVSGSPTVNSLAITTIPSETAGSGFTVTATAKDAFGNAAHNSVDSVTLSIVSGSPQTTFSNNGSTTMTTTLSSGVATFSAVAFDTAGSYTLSAKDTSASVTAPNSNAFTVRPAVASQLAFTTQPVGGVTEGTNFGTSPAVSVEDTYGNVVTTDTGHVTLAKSTGPAAGALSCSNTGFPTISAVAGVATFTNCQITGTAAAGTYTLSASRTGLTQAVSGNVVINPGAASQLAFTPATPGPGVAGSVIPSVAVSAEDTYGNVATSASGSVVMSIASGSPQSGFNSGATTVALASGVASFTNLVVDTSGSYTFTATPSGISGVTAAVNSNAFTVSGSPTVASLAITTIPSETAGSGFTVTATAKDAFGNAAHNSVDSVTLSIVSGSPQTTFSNNGSTTMTTTLSSGVATFSAVAFDTAGSYTLSAKDTSASVTAPNSNAFTVSPAVASKLAFTTQPVGGVTEGTNFGTSPAVSVEDTYGNVVTTDTGHVTLAKSTGPAAGALSCSNTGFPTISAVAGVATFTNCQITGTAAAGTYTLSASRTGLTQAVSGNVVINPGAASQLAFTTQPVGGVTEGTNFGTSPAVSVEDTYGNVVTTDTGHVTLATYSGPSAGALSCSNTGFPTISAVAGVATFTNCQITGTAAAGTYTLSASRTGLTQAVSGNVVINPGAASKLAFTTQPVGGVTEGTNFGTSPAVSVEDTYGNVVTTDTGHVTLAKSTGPAAGALSCSNTGFPTISAVAGVATFTNCQITGTAAAGTYTLSASRTGLTQAVSGNVVINVGAASQLAFTTQPVGGVTEGTNFGTSPAVSVEDTYGNVVTTDTGNVTLAYYSGPAAGALSCSNTGFPTISAVAGVATFTNCQITGTAAAGTYTLSASRTGLTQAVSGNVVINPGAASKLAFTTQPVGGVTEGTNFGTSPAVSVEDTYGNVVTTDTGHVTLAKSTGPAAGALSCSNTGFPTISAVAGVATFTNCQITGTAAAGTYTLSASRTGLTQAVSGNVVINPGAASQLAFTTQPVGGVTEGTNFGTSPAVSVEDTYGNVVTTDTGHVTLATYSGPSAGALSCSNTGFPTISAVAGVATFTNCQITGTAAAGTYTLSASRTGLTQAVSGNVVINPGAASQLAFTQSPANTGVGVAFATQPAVAVEDSYGNVVTTNTSTVTLAITAGTPTSGGPGTLTCTGGLSKGASAGIATFAGCSISTEGANYELHATDGSLVAANSSAFNVFSSGTYSGSSGTSDIPSSATYYGINASSAGSGTSTNNTITPGVGETLTGLTFTINRTSTTSHTATVGIVTSGVWAATALTCTITGGSGLTSCTITANVSVSATQSINIQAVGNGTRTGTWTTTYTQP